MAACDPKRRSGSSRPSPTHTMSSPR
jgi:hypothetical protein